MLIHELADIATFDLGVSAFRKILKKPLEIHKKIRKKIIPKKLQKAFKKLGKKFKKVFIKIAPALAIVAQVLNFIPGLGVAVGLAITAGAAALTVGAKVLETKEAAKKAGKEEKAAEAEATQAVIVADKDAHAKADEAFMKGADYFQSKYDITPEMFKSFTLDEKMAFFQQAVEDANAPDYGMYLLIGGGVLALGVLALVLLKKKKKQQKIALQK